MGAGARRCVWQSAVEAYPGEKSLSAPPLNGRRLASASVSRAGGNRPLVEGAARFASSVAPASRVAAGKVGNRGKRASE